MTLIKVLEHNVAKAEPSFLIVVNRHGPVVLAHFLSESTQVVDIVDDPLAETVITGFFGLAFFG